MKEYHKVRLEVVDALIPVAERKRKDFHHVTETVFCERKERFGTAIRRQFTLGNTTTQVLA